MRCPGCGSRRVELELAGTVLWRHCAACRRHYGLDLDDEPLPVA